jgi:hypothetical protein
MPRRLPIVVLNSARLVRKARNSSTTARAGRARARQPGRLPDAALAAA